MLRAATKQSVREGLRCARSHSTGAPPPQPARPPKSGGGGKLALTLGLTTAAAGGVLGYAYVDPEFRQKVESTVPQSKDVLNKILGEAKQVKLPVNLEVKPLAPLPKKVEVLPPLNVHQPPPLEKKPPVHVDAVEVVKEHPELVTAKPSEELVKIKNKQLEDQLLSALQSAETRVQHATDAKISTIKAVNEHATLLKKTVDDAQNADWEQVTKALQHAESLSRTDSLTEVDGRNYIDNLRKVIEAGKNDSATRSNPLLINAMETANKLNHQLDELNNLVHKARQESTILNQYKDLIDRSREQFALEIRSILPNVDVDAKGKNLNEEELNALIAHAHLRVDQLRRQLADQQLREEQHIARAIEEQRTADEKIAQEKLQIELHRVKAQKDVDVEREVLSTRSSWERELEDRLRRAAGAHSEHLEQVIRTQRQLFEIEHNQKVEEAVLLERSQHARAVGQALSRLEGIESALSSRVALDAENRRCKQFWIACHNLIDTIVHGSKAGNTMDERRAPLKESLHILQQVNPEDKFVTSIVSTFPTQATSAGVFTEQDLKNRFGTVYKTGRRTAWIDENGGSLAKYAWSWLRSMFSLELPRKYTLADKIDPNALDNLEVLSRARWYVDQGDFENAVKIVQLLQGEPAILAADWVADTRAHLETKLLAELLVAHAAVQSIRSTY